ncbi:MAG: hypothetical protein ACJ72N_04150 [Labedaea sp.]
MAEPIEDRQIVAALRPFVWAASGALAPLAGRPVRAGQLPGRRGVGAMKVPGTAAWARMSVAERDDWWINRVGRFTVLLAAIPGIGGALADRLPLQDTLAVAGQGLLLCAIAAEHGVTRPADRVRLLAAVLFDRQIDPAVVERAGDAATDEQAGAALTEQVTESSARHGRLTAGAAFRMLWRFGRRLMAVGGELDKRQKGRFYHRMLSWVPVVGMVGDYCGERSALKRAASAGTRWLDTHCGTVSLDTANASSH